MEKKKLGNILTTLENLSTEKIITESKIYLNKIDKYKDKVITLYTNKGKKVYSSKMEACADYNVSIHTVKSFMVRNNVSFEGALKYLTEGKN